MSIKNPARKRMTRTALLLAVGLIAAGPTLWAIDGRDFAGRYQTADEVESGEDVFLTFETEFFNYSGADILGATVRLEHTFGVEDPYASWPAVHVVAGDRVRLAAEVTLATRDYDAWQNGATPRLTVEWQDAEGRTWRRPVELMRDLMPTEESQP